MLTTAKTVQRSELSGPCDNCLIRFKPAPQGAGLIIIFIKLTTAKTVQGPEFSGPCDNYLIRFKPAPQGAGLIIIFSSEPFAVRIKSVCLSVDHNISCCHIAIGFQIVPIAAFFEPA